MQHLAIIPDGNRRWARLSGENARKYPQHTFQTISTAVSFCLEKKIKFLSLYAFSIENLGRSSAEKSQFFGVINKFAESEAKKLVEKGVKVLFLGDRKTFPVQVLEAIRRTEEITTEQKRLQLSFLFCYGGQQEIFDAAVKLAAEVASGKLELEKVSVKNFKERMWTGALPDPDLIVRTGKRSRLSNFFTFSSAYSELFFIDKFWPEISKNDLERAYAAFKSTKRTFGK